MPPGVRLPLLALSLAVAPLGAQVAGDAELRAEVLGRPLVLRTTSRTAGAIDSVRWGGFEYIDTLDHGRQLQSALNADVDGVFHPEGYNPTEAGSRRDHTGPASSSRLEFLQVADGELQTRSRMAYWLAPGERSSGKPAQNQAILSEHGLAKRVRVGWRDVPNVLDYRVAFRVPGDRPHRLLQFEVLTGYMPASFSTPLEFHAREGRLLPMRPRTGEGPLPVVLSTPDGAHAMGVVAAERPPGMRGPGYGAFDFRAERVVKWNCVFRLRSDQPIPPAEHAFRVLVVLGPRSECERALVRIHRLQASPVR